MADSNTSSTDSERREKLDPGFPKSLLGGYATFKKNRLPGERENYHRLAENGQRPDTMIIACCDSRSAPETIFDAAPGEMFVVRNVANIMPPYSEDGDIHGASAALEFAVQALKVKHVVIMGHARCGGITAFRSQILGEKFEPLSSGNYIGKWISLLEPVGEKIERVTGETKEELQKRLETENIRQSIEHLKTFPFISTLLEQGKIGLHGAWFDIATGELWTLNERTGEFEQPLD